jgi:membrane protease subunit HflC
VTDKLLTEGMGNVGMLYSIKFGREKVEQEIFEKAAAKLAGFGIELLDVRFKRINYNETVGAESTSVWLVSASKLPPVSVLKGQGKPPKLLVKRA